MRIPPRRKSYIPVPAAENGREASHVMETSPRRTAITPQRVAQDSAGETVREALECLLGEAGQSGTPRQDVIRAVMSWAAEQAYAAGGYSQARFALLEALETVLLLDASKKRNAA